MLQLMKLMRKFFATILVDEFELDVPESMIEVLELSKRTKEMHEQMAV